MIEAIVGYTELEANQACMRLCLKKGRGQFFA